MATTSLALIVGASRGLGLGLVRAYLHDGWQVIATQRSPAAALDALACPALTIERADINVPEDVAGLRARLHGRPVSLLMVNAGVLNDRTMPIGDVPTEEFVRLMVTNALSPLRVVEALADLVMPDGVIAVMSSGLGSVANNTNGGYEAYRASKAALNTLMRSYAARHAGDSRTLLCLTPGWVRTDMGGTDATLDIETSVTGMVNTMAARRGTKGLTYVDYQNQIVAW